MEVILTTEIAIEYLETIWKMNDLNISLAISNDIVIEQEEIWAHEAIKLVLLQAKSNLFLNQLMELSEKGEPGDKNEDLE